MTEPIQITAQPLKLAMKNTFRHASATRNRGESIWVKAKRNGVAGFGEGCPRRYVAGDELESSLMWVEENFVNNACPIRSFEELKKWVRNNPLIINRFPSAWCAIEIALLDMFTREKDCSIEKVLCLPESERKGSYTAVLGHDQTWQYTTLLDRYFIRGFTDFKIKISGDFFEDQARLEILDDLRRQHGVSKVRIRLDANNLWAGRSEAAIDYLNKMKEPVFAVEEPVASGNPKEISRVSVETGLPIILDESLCFLNQLPAYDDLPGQFIANIKLSRVGGIFRALEFIEALRIRRWPIIVGCHVGETSLLTRAALTIAAAAADNLIAQEGAYGDHLFEREPVGPVLKFGRRGRLDLSRPYFFVNVQGLEVVPVENWEKGLGMTCRMMDAPDDGQPVTGVFEMPDHYKIHYRRWGREQGEDVLLILHGGMSHSGWQAPLAKALQAISSDLTLVATDRRGCGLNANRGDLGTVEALIADVIQQVKFLNQKFKRVHLAGWCQGAQYASIAASKIEKDITSLILLTPGFFWNERFRSVISVTEKIVLSMMSKFELRPEREKAFVPIPMEATDFTLIDEWLGFIENDVHKTTALTMKSVSIMEEIQEMSWLALPKIKLPIMIILAEKDRIVDNHKVRQFMAYTGHQFSNGNGNRAETYDCGHALHFEKPNEVAAGLEGFIRERRKADL